MVSGESVLQVLVSASPEKQTGLSKEYDGKQSDYFGISRPVRKRSRKREYWEGGKLFLGCRLMCLRAWGLEYGYTG